MDPQLTEGNQKLEEVKLELEKNDENPEKVEQMKPGPLKNFFHIKRLKSSSADDVTTDCLYFLEVQEVVASVQPKRQEAEGHRKG